MRQEYVRPCFQKKKAVTWKIINSSRNRGFTRKSQHLNAITAMKKATLKETALAERRNTRKIILDQRTMEKNRFLYWWWYIFLFRNPSCNEKAMNKTTKDKEDWVIVSGCTFHTTSNKKWFICYKVVGIGTMMLKLQNNREI